MKYQGYFVLFGLQRLLNNGLSPFSSFISEQTYAILDSQISLLSPKCLSSFSSSITTDKPQSLSLHIYQTHDLETE